MRPKKRIVIYSTNPNAGSVWAFTLRTHGYAVAGVADTPEAFAALIDGAPDLDGLLVLAASLAEAKHVLVPVKWPQPPRGAPVLLLPREAFGGMSPGWHTWFDGVYLILRSVDPPEQVLDSLKIATARKRGPRKMAPPVAASSAASPALSPVSDLAPERIADHA